MRLSWDDVSRRDYRVGVDRGVLYPYINDEYLEGVAWNGLVGVDGNEQGHEKTALYSGGFLSRLLFTSDEHSGTIRCYNYPPEFERCIGAREIASGLYAYNQEYDPFGFCYRVNVGNASEGADSSYEIHLVYNAYITNLKFNAETLSSSLKPSEMAFEYVSIPEPFRSYRPLSHLIVSAKSFGIDNTLYLESLLYGSEDAAPRLPMPDELVDLFPTKEWNFYPSRALFPSDENIMAHIDQ